MGLIRLLLIGGGGHCRSMIDCIEAEGRFAIAGILDLPELVGQQMLGYPILGTDAQLAELLDGGQALITLGQIRYPDRRRALYQAACEAGAKMACVVSPRAHVSRHAQLGPGGVAMHGAIINAGARIGVNAIINSRALVEHDATIGDHCHISTGALVNGGCEIGEACFIGSGAVIAHGVRVASRCVIGAGAVVLQDTQPDQTLVGVPARPTPTEEIQ